MRTQTSFCARTCSIGFYHGVPVQVVNLGESPIMMKEGALLTSLVEVHSVADQRAPCENDPDRVRMRQIRDHITEMTRRVHHDVTAGQRLQLEGLLFQYADILSCKGLDLGRTDVLQHSIDTGDEKPVRQQLRKTPIMHNQIIDDNIDSMLKQGLIQPAKEDWASNIVLTAKKKIAGDFAWTTDSSIPRPSEIFSRCPGLTLVWIPFFKQFGFQHWISVQGITKSVYVQKIPTRRQS